MDIVLFTRAGSWRLVAGAVLCLTVLICALPARPVHGHAGGEPVIAEAPAGPFVLYVWLDPAPAVAGEQHVTISVNAPVPGTVDEETVPVLDAEVWVSATAAGDPDRVVSAPATHEQAANKLFYEARLELPQSGSWQLAIAIVSGTETATLEFALEVEAAETSGPLQRFMAWLRSLFSES